MATDRRPGMPLLAARRWSISRNPLRGHSSHSVRGARTHWSKRSTLAQFSRASFAELLGSVEICAIRGTTDVIGAYTVRPVVIIGIGNTLRQDDGLGPAVVERLRSQLADSRVELLEVQSLTPELATNIWKARRVIFVDASEALAPGEIQHKSVECDEQADVSLVHFLSPEALLVWTGRLYGCVPLAEIWLMGVEAVGLAEELTPIVATRMDGLVAAIRNRIQEELSTE